MNGVFGVYFDIDEDWYIGVQYCYWYNIGGNDGFVDVVIVCVGMCF